MTFYTCERISACRTDILRVLSENVYDRALFFRLSLVNVNFEYAPKETDTFDTFFSHCFHFVVFAA
jgi:hypothetical protein